mmetsp:Transcript_24261/g.53914  ORF Transcript_24261/g.53914 Transcript_24261/m.53914 type:complete len:214 (+) Transcript_24261:79-720(+)
MASGSEAQKAAALVSEAVQHEASARSADRAGRVEEAISLYGEAVTKLMLAEEQIPSWSLERQTVSERAAQVQRRLDYLGDLEGAPVRVPCDRLQPLVVTGAPGSTGLPILGFATTLGMAVGILTFGPRSALVIGAGAFQITTQDNSIGHLLRKVARGSVGAVMQLRRRALLRFSNFDARREVLHRAGEAVFTTRSLLGRLAGRRSTSTAWTSD